MPPENRLKQCRHFAGALRMPLILTFSRAAVLCQCGANSAGALLNQKSPYREFGVESPVSVDRGSLMRSVGAISGS